MKTLRQLLADLPAEAHPSLELAPNLETVITGVTQDTRRLQAGNAYVAVPGFRVDGHQFLSRLSSGPVQPAALFVQADRRPLWQPLADANPHLPILPLENTRAALPHLAAAFHDFPARRLTIAAVTGTDGKSTTTYLTHAVLNAAGHSVGLLNGVEFHIGGTWSRNETGETTPEADLIQARLADMVQQGDTHAVLEISSHALTLHRAAQIHPQTAAFTNLSDDHLDFHRTREAYLAAKLQLFRMLDDHPHGAAVVRAEDPLKEAIRTAHKGNTTIVTAETGQQADLAILPTRQDARGSNVRVITPAGALAARLPLPGAYNLANAALACGAAWNLGAGPIAMQTALNTLRPVPGRMEPIEAGQPFPVIVDAAATGPALRLALLTLRPHVTGRLILVFGVAGERDPSRKSSMAAAAAQLADFTIITNENPRSEDPVQMVEEIAAHLTENGTDAFTKIPDRRRAIQHALQLAQPADLVLIAGKGAEPTMIYADRTEAWDDRLITRALLEELLG